MAETTKQKTVLTIDTSGSVKSVKDLKQQIKDLKDKIVELTAAGEDCSEEYAQLGTSMRQLKEINEEAMRSSKDLGDQLKVVSGSMKGVAGAISTVTGVMGLMGVESEKGTQLLKTMASAMAITTGIQAMESGYKSLKKLIGGFAAATKGAKSLGAAIQAAFASNPVGLLLTALTAVVTVIGTIISKSKESEKDLKENLANSAQAIREAWESMVSSFKSDTDAFATFASNAMQSTIQALSDAQDEVAKLSVSLFTKDGKLAQAGLEHFLDDIDKLNAGHLQRQKENFEEARDLRAKYYILYGRDLEQYTQQELHQFEGVWARELASYQNLIFQLNVEYSAYEEILRKMSKTDERYAEYKKMELDTWNKLHAALVKYNSVMEEMEKSKKAIADKEKKEEEDKKKKQKEQYERAKANAKKQKEQYERAKANAKKQKEQYERAKANAKKQLQLEKSRLDEMYNTQKANAERERDFVKGEWDLKLRMGEVSQEEYNARMLELEIDYYNISEAYLKAYDAVVV